MCVCVNSILTSLQMHKPTEESSAAIKEFLYDLGRRHFSYGSRPNQMELLGHVFVDAFICIFDGDARRADIYEAWLAFFAFMVFWMASGYRFVQNKGVE